MVFTRVCSLQKSSVNVSPKSFITSVYPTGVKWRFINPSHPRGIKWIFTTPTHPRGIWWSAIAHTYPKGVRWRSKWILKIITEAQILQHIPEASSGASLLLLIPKGFNEASSLQLIPNTFREALSLQFILHAFSEALTRQYFQNCNGNATHPINMIVNGGFAHSVHEEWSALHWSVGTASLASRRWPWGILLCYTLMKCWVRSGSTRPP